MVSLFYSEISLHYKDCYKGCGEKSEMGGRGCDVLTLTLNWDWRTHLTL